MPARALNPGPGPAEEEQEAFAALAEAVMAMPPRDRMIFLSQLDPFDQSIVEQAIAQETGRGARANPATLAAALDPRWRPQRHLDLLGRKFREAVDGASPRQIWNLPSRYQKTTLLGWGVTWGLELSPEGQWIYLTYGDELADAFGVAVRDRLQSYPDQLHVRLRRDVARRDRFLTTEGGGLLCRGVNSSVIGFGANRKGGLLIDDPMKNWQEAHSPARRQHLFDQYTGTIRHRLDDEDAPIIVCHARWHTEDFTAQLLAHMEDETGEAWDLVKIPALCIDDVNDLLGRALGEPISEDLFTREQVLSRHRGMVSTFVVAAIELQEPLADAGNEILREWFQLMEPSEMPAKPDRAITSWDLKLKDREAGDYVVGQCWWKVGSGYWCMDQIRGQYDHATTGNAIALMAVRHPEVQQHVIEAAGSYDEVVPELRKPLPEYVVTDAMVERLGMTDDERIAVQTLRRSGLGNLKPEVPQGPKPIRARTYIAPLAEYGHVHLPAEAPWVPAYLDEMAQFPKGLHDDQVDASSQGLKRLSTSPGQISMPKRSGRRRTSARGRQLRRPPGT